MKTSIFSFSLMLFFCSSCKIHFTESTRTRIEKSEQLTMSQVQFYNDTPIKMVFKSNSKNDAIKGGKVRFKDGFYHYHIHIPRNTKAVARESEENQLTVQFEDGNETFLIFENNMHQNWELYQMKSRKTDSGNFVNYGGKQMELTRGTNVLLKVKKSQKVENDKDRRRVKGLKVN